MGKYIKLYWSCVSHESRFYGTHVVRWERKRKKSLGFIRLGSGLGGQLWCTYLPRIPGCPDRLFSGLMGLNTYVPKEKARQVTT